MNKKAALSPYTDSIPPWPLYQAIIVGCIGVFAALFVTLCGLVFVHGDEPLQPEFIALEAVLECLVTIAIAYLFLRIARRRGLPYFWESIHWCADYLPIAIWSAVGFLASVLLSYFLVRHVVIGPISSSSLMSIRILPIVLGTVILQPLIEEIYFRGILFEAIAARIGSIWSICIVTFLFVLMHVQHHWVVLPVAILLGVTRISTRSTANCFALHAAYNLGMVIWGLR